MNPFQKMAWYNLAVIALTAVVVLALIQVMPIEAAWCGFAVLALLGFAPLYLKKKKGEILYDERDKDIGQKAGRAGFFLFWLYFVAACVYIPFAYDFKTVSSFLFVYLLLVGGVVLMSARSVATLVLYRRDSEKSSAFLDSFREMADLQKSAWIGLIILSFVLTPFLLFFPIGEQGLPVNLFGVIAMISFGVVFFLMRKSWDAIEMDERDQAIVRRAEKVRFPGLGITLVIGGLVLATLHALKGSGFIPLNAVFFVGLCGFAVGLLAQPLSILVQYAGRGEKGPGIGSHETQTNKQDSPPAL